MIEEIFKELDKLTHYLRFKNDAIMISGKTLNIDNPRLNCRLEGRDKFSPIRIILDRNLEIKTNSYIFKSAKENNTIIFHNSSNRLKIRFLKKKITLIKSKLNNSKHFDLKIILKKLYALGIRNLLVEGGDKITKNFVEKRLINRFYLFKSPKNLPKRKKYQIFTSLHILDKVYGTKSKVSSKLAKDRITIYKR